MNVADLEELTPAEVSLLLKLSVDFLYTHRRELGGVKHGRAVRFPVLGLQAYQARKRLEAEAARSEPGTRRAKSTRLALVSAGPSDRSLLRLVKKQERGS